MEKKIKSNFDFSKMTNILGQTKMESMTLSMGQREYVTIDHHESKALKLVFAV